MKVKELIEHLKREDPEKEVRLEHPVGDFWRTKLAVNVTAIDRENVVWSEKHKAYKLPAEEVEVDPDAEDVRRVVLLS